MLHSELIPAAVSGSRDLMIVLHGLGDSIEGYRWLPEALAIPSLSYLLVNAPDPYYGGFSWYDFAGAPDPGVRRSRRALFEIFDLQRQNGFSASRTVLFGFSQGCLMTMDAGLRSRSRFAGLVGISGYLHEPDQLVAELTGSAIGQAVLATHGRQDTMIPIDLARRHFQTLRRAGVPVEWHEFDKGHTIAGEAELRVIREFVRQRLP